MGSRYFSCRIFKKRPKKGKVVQVKPKSFKSEESAKKWAAKEGLKKFSVEQIAPGKFKVRRKL